MVLSKREQHIAIGVGSALGALIVYSYVIAPFFATRGAVVADISKAQHTQSQNSQTLRRQRDLKPDWVTMSAGMKTDDGEAMSQALTAVREWAQEAGVDLTILKPDRSSAENKFVVSSFHVTATGSMRSVSRLVWALETSPVPLRVTDMQITPRQEGTDKLTVQLSVSTLSLTEAEKDNTQKPPAKTTVSRLDTWRDR